MRRLPSRSGGGRDEKEKPRKSEKKLKTTDTLFSPRSVGFSSSDRPTTLTRQQTNASTLHGKRHCPNLSVAFSNEWTLGLLSSTAKSFFKRKDDGDNDDGNDGNDGDDGDDGDGGDGGDGGAAVLLVSSLPSLARRPARRNVVTAKGNLGLPWLVMSSPIS